MNSDQLRQFLTVAQCGNVTRAAAELYISQPALSISISKLEDEIGKPLFLRNNRKLVLTASGEVLLDYAQRVTALISEAERTMTRKDSLSYVPVGYIGGIWIPPLLEGCYRLENNRFTLDRIHNHDVPRAIAEARYGLIIADELYTKPAAYKSVERVFLFRQQLFLMAERNDPLAIRDEISASELVGLTLIGPADPLGIKDWLMEIDRFNCCSTTISLNCSTSLFETEWETIRWPFLISSFGFARTAQRPW